MTTLQKKVIETLLRGGSISGSPKYGYRLKDFSNNPIISFTYRSFHTLKPYLRAQKGQFVLNRKLVRSMSRRYWIKRAYLTQMEEAGR